MKILFRFFARFLSQYSIYIVQSLSYRNKKQALPVNLDYVRYATLSLCYEEIVQHQLKGNLAEVGVFKGDFAKRLNLLFPNKKLYLFDTFEGFSEKDISYEKMQQYSSGTQDFSSTSIELVRSKMKYPANCIFKKGYFPDTAFDVEDEFCFVSLDADLFLPIYEGLKFFYPRLVSKGYIFIHDFNNSGYPGARDAVIKFCSENQIGYTPIPDSGGTVVITK
jgi:O-methyltransferase